MHRSMSFRRRLAGAAALSLSHVLLDGAAFAQPGGASEISVPAAPLGEALKVFSEQTGIAVVFPEALVQGKMSAGTGGAADAGAALTALLQGTGLEAVAGGGGYVIRARAVTPGNNQPPARTAPVRTPADAAPSMAGLSEAEQRLGQVTVTGTSLRGIAPESSPLQIYSREDILGSGVTTTEQFIRTLPQNFGGGSSEFAPAGLPNDINSRQNYTFGTSANLRGLGSRGTLVLLDGERLAPTSGIGDYIDLSMIPVTALERVDVLTDGASSIYGGDAVAGVINFVLRDDYDGAETSLRYGTVTEGRMEEWRLGQSLGTTWQGGSVIGTYEYFERGALSLGDRPDLAAPTLLTGGALTGLEAFDLLPAQTRHSGIVSLRQRLGDRLTLSGSGFYSERSVDSSRVLASTESTVTTSDTRSEVTGFSGRAELELTPQWYLSLSGTRSEVANHEVLRSFVTADPIPTISDFTSTLSSFDARLNGDMFQLPGGRVQTAAGMQLRNETFDFQTRGAAKSREGERDVLAVYGEVQVPLIGPDNQVPGIHRLELNLSGRVDDYSDFGTSSNPKVGLLYSPGGDLRFRGSWSTSFAPPALGRSGAIDRTGSVFPYAFILNRLGYPLPDPSLANVNYLVTGGTAADLEPETSRTFTLGMDQALSLGRHDFTLSGSYYDIDFEGRLGTTPIPGNLNPNFAPNIAFDSPGTLPPGTVIFFPSQAEIDAVLATFIRPPTLTAGATLDNIGVINNANIVRNLASTRTRGFDLNIGYETDLSFGTVTAGFNANYLLGFDQQASVSSDEISVLNTLFNPVDLTLRAQAGLQKDSLSALLHLNYVDSYRIDNTPGADRVPSWTTLDLNVSYDLGNHRPGLFHGTRLTFSARNLTDKMPPAVPPTGLYQIAGYDPANASPLGRFISIEISRAF